AVEFVAAARSCDVRPILGAHLVQQNQRATALIAEPAGYRSLCRALSRLHFGKAATLAQVLAENAEGLHLLVDDPFLLKAPLTDAFRRRLWLEIVRPGKSEASELQLLDVGSKHRLNPVPSPAPALPPPAPAPAGHAPYRLLPALRQQVSLDQLPARLPVTPHHHLCPAEEVRERFRDMPGAVANALALAEQCRCDVLPRGLVAA